MHLSSDQIFTVLSRVSGLLILYVAIFLYEDEEGRFQNRLEVWWIKVRYGRDRALSIAAEIFAFSAKAASQLFDKVFGPRLLSLRAVSVSLCLSMASFNLFAPLLSIFGYGAPGQSNTSALWSGVCFLAFAFGRCLFDTKWMSRLWNIVLILVLAQNFGEIFVGVVLRMGLHAALRFITFLGMLLTLSFAFDLLFLGLTRWMIRRTSVMTKLPYMIGFLLLNILLALALIFAPVVILVKSMPDEHHPSLLSLAAIAVIPLNSVDVVLCLFVFFVLVLFVIHRLLWPLFERPLYAIARYGLIKRKALLWAVGLALVAGPDKDKAIFHWLVDKILLLKG